MDELALNEVRLSFTVASITPRERCRSCSKIAASYSTGLVARSTGSGSLLDSDEPGPVTPIKVLLCLLFVYATVLSMALSSSGACFFSSPKRRFSVDAVRLPNLFPKKLLIDFCPSALVTRFVFFPGLDERVANEALVWNPFVFDFSVCGTDAEAPSPASGSIVLELLPLATSPISDSLTFANFLLDFSSIVSKCLHRVIVPSSINNPLILNFPYKLLPRPSTL